jgi:hypothetical protein
VVGQPGEVCEHIPGRVADPGGIAGTLTIDAHM